MVLFVCVRVICLKLGSMRYLYLVSVFFTSMNIGKLTVVGLAPTLPAIYEGSDCSDSILSA